MKTFLFIAMLLSSLIAHGQHRFTGKVVSATDSTALPGAVVKIKDQSSGVTTDENGHFALTVADKTQLVISYIGFVTLQYTVNLSTSGPIVIALSEDANQLAQVTVSTGYQKIPRERATGSFANVDLTLISRRVSTSVMDRLEDTVPGLIFNKGKGAAQGLVIRGQSTINSGTSPLIVIDNFPYEGDPSTINPNDVESITVLKDAAAASIWGSRAGNGVIVITTKKGSFKQAPKITFNSNMTTGKRPDLFYQPVMSASDFIENEKAMFAKGRYKNAENSYNKLPLTPVIELLIASRDGSISPQDADKQIEQLKQYDVRRDYDQYFYQPAVNQQYAFQLQGGSDHNRYFASAGYDHNRNSEVGNGFSRYTLSMSNTYSMLNNKLDLSTSVYYTESKTNQNNPGLPTYTTFRNSRGSALYPYARLADDQGNPLSVINQYRTSFIESAAGQGLPDWQYRPLDELRLADNITRNTDYRVNAGLHYKIKPFLTAELLYQYSRNTTQNLNLRSGQSYYTRNEINQLTFVGADGSLITPIPAGGILDKSEGGFYAHNLRAQLDFHKSWRQKHDLNAILGREIRDFQQTISTSRLYGYDDEHATSKPVDYVSPFTSFVNPYLTNLRITNKDAQNVLTDRYLSYYANAAYTLSGKYILSASGRLDQSNLFGVKANQRGVPLYSAGAAWNLHQEKFYKLSWLPYLKLRTTFGFSGNSNKNVSAYTTASYSAADFYTRLPYATVSNPPNPDLRWERVKTINAGLDFETRNRIFFGSIEYYHKKGIDLIGTLPFPGSSGIKNFTGNYAGTKTDGLEISLNSKNLRGIFQWNTNFLLSVVKDRVTHYDARFSPTDYLTAADGLGIVPMKQRPLFSVYSLRWAGLDPANGDPQGYLNGELSKDYIGIITTAKPADLIYNGPARPPVFGALRNTFSWKGFSLSVSISYRLGYYFRRKSIDYVYGLNYGQNGHGDYASRWQKPGDEKFTTVPSAPISDIDGRDSFYEQSEVLVHKADNIRLQDLNLSYDFTRSIFKKLPVGNLRVYLYANNIGILWKSYKGGLDPDYATSTFPPVRTVAAGVQISF